MEFGLEKEAKSSDYVELDVSSPTDEVQEDEVQEGELRDDSEVGEGLLLNRMQRSQEYAGRLETGRGGGKGICCQG